MAIRWRSTRINMKDRSEKFKGRIIAGKLVVDWPRVAEVCREYGQFIIEVRAYDREREISLQQMAFWHARPVKLFAQHTGYSEWKAEQWLKRECGELYFMLDLDATYKKRGTIMFECLDHTCRELFIVPRQSDGRYLCPSCLKPDIRLFFMLSKTELKTHEFNKVLENACDFMDTINCPCGMPDRQWRMHQLETAATG